MKTFREYLSQNEMASSSGDNDVASHSREGEWNMHYRNESPFKKLILKDIGAEHYSIYRVMNTFYLISEDNNYKGYISFTENNKIYIINSSNSGIKNGFYNIMFTSLLTLSDIEQIISDKNLSEQAIKSYEKLVVNSRLKIEVFDGLNSYFSFTKEKLMSNHSYRVSVKADDKKELNDHFNEYYARIYETQYDAWNSFYKNKSAALNNYLFADSFLDDDNLQY